MYTQKFLKVGNSKAVVIPKDILKDLSWASDKKISINRVNDQVILSANDSPLKNSSNQDNQEFKQWLKIALNEDGEILDELAKHVEERIRVKSAKRHSGNL